MRTPDQRRVGRRTYSPGRALAATAGALALGIAPALNAPAAQADWDWALDDAEPLAAVSSAAGEFDVTSLRGLMNLAGEFVGQLDPAFHAQLSEGIDAVLAWPGPTHSVDVAEWVHEYLYTPLHDALREWLATPLGEATLDAVNAPFVTLFGRDLIGDGLDGFDGVNSSLLGQSGWFGDAGDGGFLFGNGGTGIAGINADGGTGGDAGIFGVGGAGGAGFAGFAGGDGGTGGLVLGIGGVGGAGGDDAAPAATGARAAGYSAAAATAASAGRAARAASAARPVCWVSPAPARRPMSAAPSG